MHFLRDILTHVPRHAAAMVAAFVRTIFAPPDEPAARAQLQAVADRLATSFPKAAEVLLAGEDDVLSYLGLPPRALDQDLVDQSTRTAQWIGLPASGTVGTLLGGTYR